MQYKRRPPAPARRPAFSRRQRHPAGSPGPRPPFRAWRGFLCCEAFSPLQVSDFLSLDLHRSSVRHFAGRASPPAYQVPSCPLAPARRPSSPISTSTLLPPPLPLPPPPSPPRLTHHCTCARTTTTTTHCAPPPHSLSTQPLHHHHDPPQQRSWSFSTQRCTASHHYAIPPHRSPHRDPAACAHAPRRHTTTGPAHLRMTLDDWLSWPGVRGRRRRAQIS